jgi:DNA-directed RNA polymerase subunit RPC12/RpoP
MLSIGSLADVQQRADDVNNQLKESGLHFSTKKVKCVLIHGGPPQVIPKPTAGDIKDLKLRFACSYCGERRFTNMIGKLQHERTCDLGRNILHPGRFEVDFILDVRGPPSNRFFKVCWAPGQLGADVTWEPARNLGDHCKVTILDWFTMHPQWHCLDNVQVEGEIRCNRCNRMDFTSDLQL